MNNDMVQFKSLAIERLAFFGNTTPTNKQVEEMVFLLGHIGLSRKLLFDKRLSKREIDCLYHTALGKNVCESAKLLKISQDTIKKHRKSIKQKLRANSMANAVFLGTRYGYFTLDEKS